MSKVYDIFLYNGEKELLEIRLNVLKDVVDRFVVVESPLTFSNRFKDIHFNAEDFKEFGDKITHVVGPMACGRNAWENEWFCRNLGGAFILQRTDPEDIILLSDVDEIPNPETLRNIIPIVDTPVTMVQRYNFYKFNLECYTNKDWPGTIVTKANYIDYPSQNHEEWFSKDFGLQKLREGRSTYPKVENGGNHYSYCFNTDEIQRKLASFSHYLDLDKPQFNNPKHIAKCIEKGESIWVESDGNKMKKIEMDESNTPKYILENLNKYKHLIL